jgi:hypothetical protein
VVVGGPFDGLMTYHFRLPSQPVSEGISGHGRATVSNTYVVVGKIGIPDGVQFDADNDDELLCTWDGEEPINAQLAWEFAKEGVGGFSIIEDMKRI